MTERCEWAGDDPLMIDYHDREWGVPLHDDRRLFEFLVLEGAQAGLSWATILKKRESYRAAFAGFEPRAVAEFGQDDVDRLLGDEGIVRNRLKIESAIENARLAVRIQTEEGGLDAYLWRFVGGEPIQNRWRSLSDVPVRTPASEAMSRELKKRGFRFVGPTICYAFMQAVGMVNDHVVGCFRQAELASGETGRG